MIYFWHHVRALSKREQRAAVRAAHGMGQARGDLLEHCWGGSRCFGNLGIQFANSEPSRNTETESSVSTASR